MKTFREEYISLLSKSYASAFDVFSSEKDCDAMRRGAHYLLEIALSLVGADVSDYEIDLSVETQFYAIRRRNSNTFYKKTSKTSKPDFGLIDEAKLMSYADAESIVILVNNDSGLTTAVMEIVPMYVDSGIVKVGYHK